MHKAKLNALSTSYQTRLYRNFLNHELKELCNAPATVGLTYHEVGVVVCDIFRCRCAITGKRMQDPSRPVFCLVRFDVRCAADAANVLFVTTDAAKQHEKEGIEGMPNDLRQQVTHSIAQGLAGRPCTLLEAARREEMGDGELSTTAQA